MFRLIKNINPVKYCKNLSTLRNRAIIKKYEINGYNEAVVSLDNLRLSDCLDTFKNETISVLGYGPQGKGQSQNLRDNNYPVILGLRKNGNSWRNAISDGKMLSSTENNFS